MPVCPICSRGAAPRAESAFFPFCSPRCKQIDLGKWLSEGYRVSSDASEADDDSAALAENPDQEKP
jgi:endogenous inhibitor of DNA gyrase (YacG/DUF329 family)